MYRMSKAHWTNPDSYNPVWDRRAQAAAFFIPAGSKVLDLGCGQMGLRKFLPQGCKYVPSDIKAWSDDVIVCDLDAGEFPPGRYDVITLLGVLEFVAAASETLARARAAADRLVVSFHHPTLAWHAFSRKRREHRAHHYSGRQLRAELTRAGWAVDHSVKHTRGGHFATTIYSCH